MKNKNYSIQEINSIAKDMKYEALYWALGFEEKRKDLFAKEYSVNKFAGVYTDRQQAVFADVRALDGFISLKTPESFVVLECIDRLIELGAKPEKIIFGEQDSCTLRYWDYKITCYEWGHMPDTFEEEKIKGVINVHYTSRLVSGVVERKYCIRLADDKIYTNGIFESQESLFSVEFSNPQVINDRLFEIEGTTAVSYSSDCIEVVYVPEGVKTLSSGLFWDNQNIKKVVLPQTLESLGGDTFYNCRNLIEVTIPKNVRFMGNNPFAGCPNLKLKNESPFFKLVDGALYNQDFTRLIYYPINSGATEYHIKNGTKLVGKHAFFMCNSLTKIEIPASVIKLENNPFSGCQNLKLENHSPKYNIVDDVIYDADFSSVTGCLNSIKTDRLVLKDVKRICRNSFWNCKGIKTIVLPATLQTIGYNPFVGCSNIEFVSKTPEYVVENGILFNADKTTLVCYPSKLAKGEVHIPDTVTKLERGAFSGCSELTAIQLHNASVISKTCFTDCNSLKEVYCSDLVSYIGEWAFAHCKSLQELSVYKDCFIDKNVILNSPAKIVTRTKRTNYVIESDNLYTLKSLKSGYEGKIKAVLIDPPYNSHIDYIGYKDDSFAGGYKSFMEKRLALAHSLLSQDGFAVINIDQGGLEDIVFVCNKIFGAQNVVVKKWKTKHEFFDVNRVVRNPDKVQTEYEYVVFAAKSQDAQLNKIMQPYLKDGKLYDEEAPVPEVFDCFGTNSSAKDEIEQLFGSRDYFSTPKPVKLIKEFVRATTDSTSIVLDFFAGSGTTGHAVKQLNDEDGGTRSFILVSNNESDICRKVTMKRMDVIGADYVSLS
ncbi:MAG: leucine-rich repeat protein [Treponema sp.]|nr:leucine-rich repeat protein [Treponema sp.]